MDISVLCRETTINCQRYSVCGRFTQILKNNVSRKIPAEQNPALCQESPTLLQRCSETVLFPRVFCREALIKKEFLCATTGASNWEMARENQACKQETFTEVEKHIDRTSSSPALWEHR